MYLNKIKYFFTNYRSLSDGIFYTAVKYLTLILGFIKTILVAKYLGPHLLGIYALLVLCIEYLYYSNLGVLFSFNREVSINLNDEDKKQYINEIFSNTVSLIFTSIVFVCFCSLLIKYFIEDWINYDINRYLYFIITIYILNQIKQFLISYFRLYQKYKNLMFQECIGQLFILIGVIFFLEQYLIEGYLWISIFGHIFTISIGLFFVNLKFKFKLNYFSLLIYSGLPLLFYNMFNTLLTSIDRLIINTYLIKSDLGIYQLGYSLSLGIFLAFNAIAFLFYPKFLNTLLLRVEEDNTLKMKEVINMTKITEILVILLSIIGIIAVPVFINLFLPEYQKSIYIAQILLTGYIFNVLIFFISTFLISNNEQIKLSMIMIFSLLLGLLMNYFVIKLGYGIYAIVLVTTIMFFTNSVLTLYLFTIKMNLSFLKYLYLFFYKYIFIYLFSVVIISFNNFYILLAIIIPFYFLYKKEIYNLLSQVRHHLIKIYEQRN